MARVERAVILAAGLGSRLKWLTEKRPKALMMVAGEVAIVRVIRKLAGQGIRDIAINTHHHADVLRACLGDGSRFGVRLYFSFEASLLDSGGGARTALALLPGDGLVAVHNTDILSDIDMQALAHLCPIAGCAIALTVNPAHHPEGDFSIQNGQARIQGEPRYTFSGVSVWDAQVLEKLPVKQAYSLIEPMRDVMAQGRCAGMLHHGLWFDIGRPADLFRAGRALRGGQ